MAVAACFLLNCAKATLSVSAALIPSFISFNRNLQNAFHQGSFAECGSV
jgi:hypothetical protein